MRILTLALTLFIAVGASAGEIDRAVAALSGSEASFVHRFTPKGFKSGQVESGTVIFGNLPQMRWSYSRPEQKLFVFDGSRSWFYIPAEKQVTVIDLDENSRAEMPFLLLGDPVARDRNFVVRETSRGGSTVVTLQPRSAASKIRSVTVTISAAAHLIQRVEYSDREGNQTSFDFSGTHKREVSADLFRFSPPAGVQVVQQ
jgi:outer membrane lipoprotein carrier protein